MDGTELLFECEPIDYSPRRAICLYRSSGSFKTTNFSMPNGGLSYGFFWQHRPYILYRFSHPDGRCIGHRFDIVDNVRFDAGGVAYRDLVLDLWVPIGGEALLEDRDELEELLRAGTVDGPLADRAGAVASLLLRRHPRITAEVEREVAPFLPR